ncbi:PHP domain-containing protein, partial [Corynebacterium nasicanis]
MRFNGGAPLNWSRLERILSGRPGPAPVPVDHQQEGVSRPARADPPAVEFAELHAVSSYSFLGGASDPESLVERAVELGLSALALVDRDGFYGAVKFAEAAAAADLPTVFGAELTLGERVLPVLARGPEGYRRLSHLMTQAHMVTGVKGEVAYPPVGEIAALLGGHCVALLGHEWAGDIAHMVDVFGTDDLVLEYAVTMTPEDADHHEKLDECRRHGLRAVATALPAAATREQARLAGA